jgi:hypothetical protein
MARGVAKACVPNSRRHFAALIGQTSFVAETLLQMAAFCYSFGTCLFVFPHAREQYTELAEQTGWLTSLYALGRSLLNFSIEVLEIEEMEAWRRFELGRNLRAGQGLH